MKQLISVWMLMVCVCRERSTSSSTSKTSCGGERRTDTGMSNYISRFLSKSKATKDLFRFPLQETKKCFNLVMWYQSAVLAFIVYKDSDKEAV